MTALVHRAPRGARRFSLPPKSPRRPPMGGAGFSIQETEAPREQGQKPGVTWGSRSARAARPRSG